MKRLIFVIGLCLALGATGVAQTTSELLGTVVDQTAAMVPGARLVVRSMTTGLTYSAVSGDAGQYRFPLLPPGTYELTVEKQGFAKYVQKDIELALNQRAEMTVKLQVSGTAETVMVTSEVPLINTTSAEVGVNFDTKRISELPLAPNSNILNAALSVPGISQLSTGNSGFTAGGVSFSANGMRTRSNNFMVDGTDSNSASVGGLLQEINNPDTVAEFRVITNQFAPEYGRAAGSVVNIITKSGTNEYHGSLFWKHNSNPLNSRSNLDKRTFTKAPWRIENQFSGTVGGPIIKNKTFFFGSLTRWTDRQFASGANITGAPTEAGKALLRPFASTRPALNALLEFLPAAQTAGGPNIAVNVGGQALQIPTGTLSGAQPGLLNDWQWMARGDHRFSDKHAMSMRLLWDDRTTITGQSVPPGLTSLSPAKRINANIALTSNLTSSMFNELRASFGRFVSETQAADAKALLIPSFEVTQLGLTGFNAANARTAIGLAVNLPQAQVLNNYQLADNFSLLRGKHSMKMGFDFRRQDQNQDFNPTIRGRLAYQTLQDVINDTPNTQAINSFLPGVPRWQGYKYYDYFFYVQDEWRIRSNFTLTYGVRYESPGNAVDFLRRINDKVVANNNNNPAYRMDPPPNRDTNNWAPRVGFNWRPPKMGFLTGEDKLVVRGGYSRTYDLIFNNIVLNVFSSFPFTLVSTFPARAPNGFVNVQNIATGRVLPTVTNPSQITRTIVNPTYRAPLAEQFSMQVQRELVRNWAATVGYVATKGTALFMTLDGNPTVPGTNASGTIRVNPARGIIRERANASSSVYHSLQTSLEKRLSKNFAVGAHYTWSSFMDDQSEIFNSSVAGEVAVAQDSFNRKLERGRSTYDRPHRLTTNFTWELPFQREQTGVVGHVLGGWMFSGHMTFQSGSPFSALAGTDPGFRLSGIDTLVGNSIRPSVASGATTAGRGIEELFPIRASLFTPPTVANPIGNAGRNILRADGIGNVDLAINKSIRMPFESHSMNVRFDFFNLTNTRNFGIPEARINNAGFMNQWNTDGGNRRITATLRYLF